MNIHELCGPIKNGGLASKMWRFFDEGQQEHRLEHVATIGGVDWINDSKSTNVNATWFALASMNKRITLIMGGVDKGNDYAKLDELVKEKVNNIILIGKNNKVIRKYFQFNISSIQECKSIKDAVIQAYKIAKAGTTVLLSPACASFDLFDNYEDRGRQFKKEVKLI